MRGSKGSLRAGALCFTLMMALAVTAAAHGHRGGGHHGGCNDSGYDDSYGGGRYGSAAALCPVEGCEQTGYHVHDGVAYCGYAHQSGVCDGSCYALCPAAVSDPAGCPAYGQTDDTAAGCARWYRMGIAACPVEGCDQPGRHTHDGTLYCGYAHEGGACSGSCCPLCPVEGCDLPGRHFHDDTLYCGSVHAAGFCDGSCAPHWWW